MAAMNAIEHPSTRAARRAFVAAYGREPERLVSARGRVNLLGDHTDYNGGFVLPTALPRRTQIALASRAGPYVRVYSATMRQSSTYELGYEERWRHWIDYVQGVTFAARKHGLPISGFDLAISSELPIGSGLSSSAALEVALLRALREQFSWPLDDLALARLAQRGENELVGAPVGLLDPLACLLADTESALFVDMTSLHVEHVPLLAEAELVVMDSGIRHDHASSDYRERRAECAAAASDLGVHSLRELTAFDPMLARLSPRLAKRVHHVLTENDRVLRAVSALRAADAPALGELFNASHASLRDDYQVSLPELDLLVGQAQSLPAVFGARMMGGGFGGAIVCLVRAGAANDVASALAQVGGKPLWPSAAGVAGVKGVSRSTA